MSDYKIQVTAFKKSGKYYSSNTAVLKEEHRQLQGFELSDLIKANDASVHCYSPVVSGFKPEFNYVIDVEYPLDDRKFCYFLLVQEEEVADKIIEEMNREIDGLFEGVR